MLGSGLLGGAEARVEGQQEEGSAGSIRTEVILELGQKRCCKWVTGKKVAICTQQKLELVGLRSHESLPHLSSFPGP